MLWICRRHLPLGDTSVRYSTHASTPYPTPSGLNPSAVPVIVHDYRQTSRKDVSTLIFLEISFAVNYPCATSAGTQFAPLFFETRLREQAGDCVHGRRVNVATERANSTGRF